MAPVRVGRAKLCNPRSVQFIQGLLAEGELNVGEATALGPSPLAVALELLLERPSRAFALALYASTEECAKDLKALLETARALVVEGTGQDVTVRIVCEAGGVDGFPATSDEPRLVARGVRACFTTVTPGKWDNTMSFCEPMQKPARVLYCMVPTFGRLMTGRCPLHSMRLWQKNTAEGGVPSKEPDFVALRAEDADAWHADKWQAGGGAVPLVFKHFSPRLLIRVAAEPARPGGGRRERESDDEGGADSSDDGGMDAQPPGGVRKRVRWLRSATDPYGAERAREQAEVDEWERLRRLFDEWRDEAGRLCHSDVRAVWAVYADAVVADKASWDALTPDEQTERLRSAAQFELWLAQPLEGGAARACARQRDTIALARSADNQRRFCELFQRFESVRNKESGEEHWRRFMGKPWMLAALPPPAREQLGDGGP